MPEVRFKIRWPDGSERLCYSPSTVIRDFLKPGDAPALPEFVATSTAGLNAASARVAARWGQSCSRAAAEIDAITGYAKTQSPDGTVVILTVE